MCDRVVGKACGFLEEGILGILCGGELFYAVISVICVSVRHVCISACVLRRKMFVFECQ